MGGDRADAMAALRRIGTRAAIALKRDVIAQAGPAAGFHLTADEEEFAAADAPEQARLDEVLARQFCETYGLDFDEEIDEAIAPYRERARRLIEAGKKPQSRLVH